MLRTAEYTDSHSPIFLQAINALIHTCTHIPTHAHQHSLHIHRHFHSHLLAPTHALMLTLSPTHYHSLTYILTSTQTHHHLLHFIPTSTSSLTNALTHTCEMSVKQAWITVLVSEMLTYDWARRSIRCIWGENIWQHNEPSAAWRLPWLKMWKIERGN